MIKRKPHPFISKLRGHITRFEQCVREHEMAGSQDPADAQVIEQDYEQAREHLFAAIRDIDLLLIPMSMSEGNARLVVAQMHKLLEGK